MLVWWVLVALAALVAIVTIVDIVRRRLEPSKMAAWILLIVIFPFVASLIYWIKRTPSEAEVARAAERHSYDDPSQHMPPR